MKTQGTLVYYKVLLFAYARVKKRTEKLSSLKWPPQKHSPQKPMYPFELDIGDLDSEK